MNLIVSKTCKAWVSRILALLVILGFIFCCIPCQSVKAEENENTVQSEGYVVERNEYTREFHNSTLTSRQYERNSSVVGYVMWILVFVCVILILVYIVAEKIRQKKELRQRKLESRPRLIITSGYQEDIE